MLVNPETYPGGEPPGAAGAHHPPVLVGHVPEHVGHDCKGPAAVGAAVYAGSMVVKFGLGDKRGVTCRAVSPGADNEQTR